MKKLLIFLGFILETLCVAFSGRIILPITKIIPVSNGDLFGCAILLPYALISLIVGLLVSLILIIHLKKSKNKFLLNIQKFITILYLILGIIFIIFLILNKQ